MAGRKTRSTNEILVDILNELAEHTDSEHGLTVKELSDRVGATEKTVHAHLQLLEAQRPMGRTVRRLTAADMRQADSADACTPRMVHGACDRCGRAAPVR